MRLVNPVLSANFSPTAFSSLSLCVHRGYAVVNALMDQHDMFKWIVGKELYPELKNIAVQTEMRRMVEKGFCGMQCSPELNHQKNCHHLEVFNDSLVMTVSQVKISGSMPRHAVYRAKHCDGNQVTMYELFGLHDVYDETEVANRYYCLLTHGSFGSEISAPGFIHIGVPAQGEKGWIEFLDLGNIHHPHSGETNTQIAESLGIELRDIEDFAKKNL